MRVEMITPLVRIYDTAGDHHETQQRKATSQAEFPDKEPIVHTSDPFEEANVIRKSHRIKITGSSPPPPLRSFAELHAPYSAPQRLLANLSESHFHEPTPIQRQAIPAILARREVLAVAPTGSGKTLAFLLPLVIHTRALLDAAAAAAHTKTETTLSRKTRSSKANTQSIPPQQQEQQTGVLSVIVSPTKELSVQTGRVLKPLLPGLRLRCSVLSKATAAGTDFSKVDILLANPLRLGAMATEGAIDLSHVHTLILDEADKLFDLGFTPQIDAVIAACTNKDLIRCLFSATLPETVENLARSVLKDPLRVTIGERNTAVSAVDQRLVFVGRESGKLLALRQLITEGLQPPVLVFVNTKERAKELHRELMYDGVHVDSLHAAQSQAARQIAVDNFRLGKTWVLVATDLVARGMDFAGVNTVVNFDFPCSTTDYIHRVGRTGRAGRSGNAVTLYTEEDVGQLRSIANVIRAAGCEVPEWMLNLKKEKNKYKKRSRSDSGNGGVAGAETITTDPERAKQLVKKKKKTKKKEVELLESRGHLAREQVPGAFAHQSSQRPPLTSKVALRSLVKPLFKENTFKYSLNRPCSLGFVSRRRTTVVSMTDQGSKSVIGLVGLAVMGQNLALNIADKGFNISVYNRSSDKTDAAVARAQKEGLGDKLHGYKDLKEFVSSLERPRRVIILVKAGAPVDSTIAGLSEHMEPGDIIIDGGNEWYENTERRQHDLMSKGIIEIGMGVSGGEEGARRGPAMMPGGDAEAYKYLQPIVEKVAAQTNDGPCVTYIGPGGAGNYVKMVHNGIEYGDMQLISEAYDILRVVGGLNNEELATVFDEWNKSELESFLVEITASIFKKKDEEADGFLVDKVLDKTGMKGTGKWTIQQAAELSIAAPTMAAALDARFLSGLKDERVAAEAAFQSAGVPPAGNTTTTAVDKQQLVSDVCAALYASKICSYAQGYNIIRAKSAEKGWNVDLGSLARIWKGGCIIRAGFLDRIKAAYLRNPSLPNLLVDPDFAKDLAERQAAWRRVVALAVTSGIGVPGMTASLSYFDTYRRGRLPANLVQAQRDFFGSHTYERVDKEGAFHTVWDESFASPDSITTSGYNQ